MYLDTGDKYIMTQTVLIADPRDVIRTGVKTIFENDNRVSDVYEAHSCEGAQEYLSDTPDLVIIHQSLVSNITSLPSGKFVLLIDNPDIKMLFIAFQHHARGYLSENVSSDLLLATLNPKNNSFLLDPAFFPWITDFILNENRRMQEMSNLSPREREIISLLREGIDKRTIAQQLNISETTLKTHIKNISRKKEDMRWLSEMSNHNRYMK
jgi:DNA-binding NarL/FixJ family response regulator